MEVLREDTANNEACSDCAKEKVAETSELPNVMHKAYKVTRESSKILMTNLLLIEIKLMQIKKDKKFFFKFPFSAQIKFVFSHSGTACTT